MTLPFLYHFLINNKFQVDNLLLLHIFYLLNLRYSQIILHFLQFCYLSRFVLLIHNHPLHLQELLLIILKLQKERLFLIFLTFCFLLFFIYILNLINFLPASAAAATKAAARESSTATAAESTASETT